MQLFSPATAKEKYDVVYNLYTFQEGLFLPNAFIVSKDKEGYFAHIKQRATVQTLSGFQLELSPERAQILNWIDLLDPKNLEKKFSPPSKVKSRPRKIIALEKLLKEEIVKKTIIQYIHRILDQILVAILQNDLPITWEVERRVLVKDFIIALPKTSLVPHLSFKRTDKSVSYQLRLSHEGNRPWSIQEREVFPVTNHPAWIFVDHQLIRIQHINGNMVKPFQQKEVLNIPATSVKTYFQKFILKVVSKIDVEAQGFDVIQQTKLSFCSIELIKDLFKNEWALAVKMNYGQFPFDWRDQAKKRTTLNFREDDVKFLQIIRDAQAEEIYIDQLKNFGLEEGEGSAFTIKEKTDEPMHIIYWLAEHRAKLEEAGFQVKAAMVEEKKIHLRKASLKLDAQVGNDWFDIYGQVDIPPFTIPFLALVKNIRDGDRFYRLPDDSYFLIPQEWMTKYKTLAQFLKRDGKSLKLNKAQFTLLKEVGLGEVPTLTDQSEVEDFKPSSLLKASLRPYQLEGVKWMVQLYNNQLGACLADDMGLGKTIQTITLLLHAKEHKVAEDKKEENSHSQLDLFGGSTDEDFLNPLNALIVLPASLVFNWEREIQKFAPSLSVYKHTGPKRYKDLRLIKRFDVILTTYQTALRDLSVLSDLEYEYIILDESQQIKNKDSKIFKAINQLEANHKVSLSGTPIENSLSDLWAQMQFINPDLLGSFNFFKKEFIRPIERKQNEEKKVQLRSLVQPYMLRRTKEEVAKDLPDLSTKVFYTEMTAEQKKMYEREKSATRNQLLENFEEGNPKFKMMVLQSLTKLRQIVNHPKLVVPEYERESGKFNDIIEHWEVIRKGGHKVLFFSSFVKHLELFKENFEQRNLPYSWLSGETSAKKRVAAIEKFDAHPDVQSFLISIKSGGTGLNLTAADYVFILDPWWNPSIEQQAIARAHRIGQDKKVFAFKFITKGSIEEKILRLQERKAKLAHDIIENAQKANFSKSDIEYLLE